MKKILAFAGSNSSTSINHELVLFAASQIADYQVKVIRLTDYNLALFSEDIEKQDGYSVELTLLKNEIREADALLISVNEHNGMVSAFFKNVTDWLSRLDRKFLDGKKVLLMSTSNGKRGAASAMAYTKDTLPRFGAEIVESFSFPSFSENFSVTDKKITNETLYLGFIDVLQNFLHQIDS
ncbi:NAD(P)H-dependent oxidoreductase [Altibacter sp.]|uniref:NADPH-dependent FMN reductase n=1 Tax=Altibacter sp. TaxID=2024823 RepID=UPI00258B40F9|nr:NAD(P)H-dependent oxidoreductase [Altibacter sp.]MCW9036280.1 NAD(P)H-dependent oxidoreductase [Altibacter sp.]